MKAAGIATAAIAAAAVALPGSPWGRTAPATGGTRKLAIVYTAEIHGAVEPCGCTSDPLGDIARLGHVVELARREMDAVLLVDAGSLLYPPTFSEKERDARDLRGEFLAAELVRLGSGGIALGETDLARGPDRVRPKRLASNLAAAAFVEAPRVRAVGGIRVGILGVADPGVAQAAGLRVDDAATAAKRDAETLRRDGAEVVIALAPVERAVARRIAREAPVDFVVLGRAVGMGMPRAEAVGQAFVVAPADEMQKVGRIDVVLRGGGRSAEAPARISWVDAGGPESRRARLAELDRALESLDADLARWSAGGAARMGADAAFIDLKKRERQALAAERASLEAAGPWSPPAQAPAYFINQLIPLRRALPRDRTLAAAVKRLDARIGAAGLRAARPPPPAEPGRAAYVGDAKCAGCHKPAMKLWKNTVHAQAWKTLVDDGKAAHRDCVKCHVTGFEEVGGSSLGFTKGLQNVQCETCHGPASIHVEELGTETPPAVRRDVPETTCTVCHNEKHSDTFEYQAYLRDILGPGHAEEARKRLGPGPTGKELRAAAVKKAKEAGQAQVKRM